MVKKWKIFIIFLLILISYSIFTISETKAHGDFVSSALNPYNLYEESSKKISLIGADDVDFVKHELMEISDSTKVSFRVSITDSLKEDKIEHYLYLQDNKYLSTYTGLSKDIDIKTFNALEKPITNNNIDDYYFDFPIKTDSFKVFPFNIYDKSNLSNQIIIFGELDKNIDKFINELGAKGILFKEDNFQFENQNSLLKTIYFTINQNPLGPLIFSLFFIVLFISLYQDRRNLSIKLVNGYSKTQYILEKIKSLFWIQNITFIGGFFILYLLSYYLNFEYLYQILSYYLSVVLIINILVIIVVGIIVYSFTDINHLSYIQGVKSRSFTTYIIGALKLIISFLILISLIPSIFDIIHTSSLYNSVKDQTDKYSDIYILESTGDYFLSMVEKSDEIVESFKNFDNVIYIKPFSSEESGESKHKVVRVNDNYIKNYPILDKNKNPINPNKKNVVYTKSHNVLDVEELKKFPGFLCESEDNCLDIETIILDDDAVLTLLDKDLLVDNEFLSHDFILVPQSNNLFILQLFFKFENNNEKEVAINQLNYIVDTQLVSFESITKNWINDLSIYKSMLISDSITLFNYLIIIFILSIIYYQIKLDKVKKEFSIYWVNGISKFNYFYFDYLVQIILSGIMILLVKKMLYPEVSIFLVLILFLIYISIDTLSLIIFRHRFYSELQKNIKEQS